MTLHAFLFDRLWHHGVRHIFGIPGDYALPLYEALARDGRFTLVRLSHEPAVGFAADGAARVTGGLGVCLVTYGAGGLNMVNPVACAYAEESPLVVISGAPGRAERRPGMHVHHEVKSFESQFKVYAEVTEYGAILDDEEKAAWHIVHALDVAVQRRRPVYLEVPRDMVNVEIAAPHGDPRLHLETDDGAVNEAAGEIAGRLRAAERPVLIVGVETHRFHLQASMVALAERLNVPVASSFLGRGAFPARHPQFAGTYLGVTSPGPLRDIVESSDCVLLMGERISDTSLGVSAHRLDEHNLIICTARDVFIRHHRYQHAPIDRLVERLLSLGLPVASGVAVAPRPAPPAPEASVEDGEGDAIRMTGVIDVLNAFFDRHPEVPLVCDTGDSLFAAVEIRANESIAPAYYATMGFAVPAAIGLQVASGRRPLVLVGDGAFQMTGLEIAHAPEYGCDPLVIVLNNNRWEMLQAFFPDAAYNEIPSWPFARLGELWGGRGVQVRTAAGLAAALADAWQDRRFAVIEVELAKGDISPSLARFVEAFKTRVAPS